MGHQDCIQRLKRRELSSKITDVRKNERGAIWAGATLTFAGLKVTSQQAMGLLRLFSGKY